MKRRKSLSISGVPSILKTWGHLGSRWTWVARFTDIKRKFSRGNPSCSPCRGMAPEFEEYFNEIVVSDAPLHFVKSRVGLDSQDGVDTSLGAAVVE